jgi:hypothetical protein
MKRFSTLATWIAGLFFCLVAAGWMSAGCGKLVDGQVTVELVTGCRPSLAKLQQTVQMYCISLEREDGVLLEGPNCSASLEGVELKVSERAEAVIVVVEGYERLPNDKHQVVLRGKSSPVLLVSGEDDQVQVPVAPVGFFGLVAAAEADCPGLPFPLSGHTATAYPSGHLILIGSDRPEAAAGQAALVIDTHAQVLEPLATPTSLHRSGHFAAPITDGRLLVAGGSMASSGQASRELVMLRGTGPMNTAYNRHREYFSALKFEQLARFLVHARPKPAAAVFYGEQVLIADGDNPPEMFMGDSEVSDLFSVIGGQAFPENGNTVTVVPYSDNMAMLVGSANRIGRLNVASGNREARYDGFNITSAARDAAPSVKLPNGMVVVVGNQVGGTSSQAVVLEPGDSIVDPELFQIPSVQGFPEWGHAITPLGDGRVLVVGGYSGNSQPAATFILTSDGVHGRYRAVEGPPLNIPRRGHTATLLPDGRVLVVGGYRVDQTSSDPARSIEVITF